MKKSIEYMGSIGIITGLAYLLFHANSVKANVQKRKRSFTKSRQLVNRLIKQLKETKQNSVVLRNALKKMNLKPIKSHLNHFNKQLQPELQNLRKISQRMKK